MEQILNTLITLLMPVLVALLVAAVAAWGNAMIYAAQMIYQAYLNKELATGPEKMAWVVAQVKAYLPRLISMIVNDSRVQSACQSIYDAIKMFAVAYHGESDKGAAKMASKRKGIFARIAVWAYNLIPIAALFSVVLED